MLADFLILLAALVLPMGFMLGFVYGMNRWAARKRLRVPVAEKLLRAPGESLRRKLEELDEKLAPELIAAFVGPFLFASFILAQQHHAQVAMGPVGLTLTSSWDSLASGRRAGAMPMMPPEAQHHGRREVAGHPRCLGLPGPRDGQSWSGH